MIQTLRKKLVRTIMMVLVLLVLLANLVVHLSAVRVCGQMSYNVLEMMAENAETLQNNREIQIQRVPIPGTLTMSRDELLSILTAPLFAVKLDSEGSVTFFGDFQTRTPLEAGKLEGALETIAQRHMGGGRVGVYRYYKAEKSYGSFVAVTDSSQGFERTFIRHLSLASIVVSMPILFILLLVSVFLSRFALTPAEDAFRKQKQFISDAGHELKTPLSTISVNAAVLQDEVGENKYLDCIQSEARRMDGLVRQLLEVTCVEDGESKPHWERFSLSDAIYQSTLPFESLAFERGIHYGVEIAEDCFWVGDGELLRQVATILLDNAFKYTDDGGEVSISLAREGRRFVLQVFNTGAGISQEDLPHIFERFYRCDKARPGNGSYGLGLSIAQAAVRACGGSIQVESELGHGATFSVIL